MATYSESLEIQNINNILNTDLFFMTDNLEVIEINKTSIIDDLPGIIYDGITLQNIVSAKVDKELGGGWTVDIQLIYNTAPDISLGDEIIINKNNIDNEKFIVIDIGETRTGEEKYLDISVIHQIFRLEGEVVGEDYIFEGNIIEQVEKLFTYQRGKTVNVAVEPSMSDVEQENFLNLESELEFKPGNLYQKLKNILKQFYARFRLEGNTLFVMPQSHIKFTTISFEYGLNNKSINRNKNYDSLIKTLVAQAWIKNTVIDGNIDPTIIKEFGAGVPVRFKDFGTFTSESDLDYVANKYLTDHQIPEAEYKIEGLDLLRMNEEDRPEEVSSIEIDTGLGCRVIDEELGINNILKIQRYKYSLLEPESFISVTVGQIENNYLKQFQNETIQIKEEKERREPKLYSDTDREAIPDPQIGKDGDVFVKPE